ncbi:MAG: hypothetical protein IPH85_10395 [Ignavibacteria bacterium]|nr:hypothetical protein [Ignavibacteria bacterium]MBK7186312.1 hypothetical protein [Ignavibacteria bacterium]MBK7411088.1 hypothetical protein [Ignavibacteria bacterium]MBL0322348.1 hypothetical protein [Ignavibacteria bacterium]MBP6509615.1 hypothetical protein [Candidatus Kapabacteria bacterium]
MRRTSALTQPGIPWRYGLLPDVLSNGTQNPARTVAIFTVHGIGDQRHAETANAMRVGFEAAVDCADENCSIVAEAGVPYVHDGWWGNYDDFEASMPEVAATLGAEERAELVQLFRARSLSGPRTLMWFIGRLLRMISPKTLVKVGITRYITYLLMGLLSVLGMIGLLIRMPRVMATIVNDVRVYGGPEGDTERAICENIDRRVAAAFLRMFGLDLNLDELPDEKKIHLESKPVTFDTVVWVSHSLGTVISYNTMLDVVSICRDAINAASHHEPTDITFKRAEAAQRVIAGFHRFITMGSPLQKATFLFEECLRDELESSTLLSWLTSQRMAIGRTMDEWWMNYYLVMDPVSGRLLHTQRFKKFVRNIHPSYMGLPAASHTSYWSKKLVSSPILSRALGKEVFPYNWQVAEWGEKRVSFTRVIAFFLVVSLPFIIYYALRWYFSF